MTTTDVQRVHLARDWARRVIDLAPRVMSAVDIEKQGAGVIHTILLAGLVLAQPDPDDTSRVAEVIENLPGNQARVMQIRRIHQTPGGLVIEVEGR